MTLTRKDAAGTALTALVVLVFVEGVNARPHFHARYQDHAASIDLAGEVIAGSLPARALRLVAEWTDLRHDELLANWEQARRNEPLEPIDPLP